MYVPRFNTPPGLSAGWAEFKLPVKFKVSAGAQVSDGEGLEVAEPVGVEVAVPELVAVGVATALAAGVGVSVEADATAVAEDVAVTPDVTVAVEPGVLPLEVGEPTGGGPAGAAGPKFRLQADRRIGKTRPKVSQYGFFSIIRTSIIGFKKKSDVSLPVYEKTP